MKRHKYGEPDEYLTQSVQFIEEQAHNWFELRAEFDEDEKLVWSPFSNRHCCWAFKPNNYAKRLWG